MFKMSMQVKPVKPRRLSASLIANDNSEVLWSTLKWRDQAYNYRRVEDLNWQINFATMQLKNWHNLDNGAWEPLVNMRDRAEAELNDLISG